MKVIGDGQEEAEETKRTEETEETEPWEYRLDLQTSTKHYLSSFVFCLCSCCPLHLLRRYSYTPTYPTVLTIVHLNGTSILSLYSIVCLKRVKGVSTL
jgi:hypothetical protein